MTTKPTYPCDADRLRGHQTRLLAVEIVAAYRRRQSANHGHHTDRAGNQAVAPAMGIVAPVLITGRDQVTPPLMSDSERGAGNSTNARLHRLIGKYRDMT